MLVFDDGDARKVLGEQPSLDREATRQLVADLHPHAHVTEIAEGNLGENADPDDDDVYAACFGGVTLLCTAEAGEDRPSQVSHRLLTAVPAQRVTLITIESPLDWFAFGRWHGEDLVRALSLSPDEGVIEDVGPRVPFEEPYWAGGYPVQGGLYPLPFHPLDLGEEAVHEVLGTALGGAPRPGEADPASIPLLGYRIER
jgi:hypothetical protein